MLKRRYDKRLQDLRSVAGVIQNRVEFESGEKIGESYQVGVMVRPPQGVTYSGSSGAAATLSAQRNAVTKQASVVSHELNLIERISLKALAAAVDKGEQALGSLLDEAIAGMKKSIMNRVELSALRGQAGLATVESVNDLGGGSAEYTITAATFAPGIWWFLGENCLLDTFNGTTKRNSNGAQVLTKIDARNRKITITYTTAVQTVAGDTIWATGSNTGASAFNEPPGLIAQANNTTGTSLGIDASIYNNWKGNPITVSGEFSLGVLEDAFAFLRDRGATGKLTAYVSNRAYSRLAVDIMATRVIDQSYSTSKQTIGTKALAYESADIDEVEIVRHPFLAWGEAMILPESDISRIGTSDVTFGIPGMKDDLFVLVPGTNTVEFQVFSDQAPVIKKPNFSAYITGITY